MTVIGKTIEIENHVANRGSYTPNNFSIGLLLSTSTLTRIGANEVDLYEPMGSYSRFAIQPDDWSSSVEAGEIHYTLNKEVHFGPASSSWPNISRIGLFADDHAPGNGSILRAISINGGGFTVGVGETVCFHNPVVLRIPVDTPGRPQSFRKRITDHLLGIQHYQGDGLWIGLIDVDSGLELGMRKPAPASLVPSFLFGATSWVTDWASMEEDVYFDSPIDSRRVSVFLSPRETGLEEIVCDLSNHAGIVPSCVNGPFHFQQFSGNIATAVRGSFWGGI